jgi:hypothetical protein
MRKPDEWIHARSRCQHFSDAQRICARQPTEASQSLMHVGRQTEESALHDVALEQRLGYSPGAILAVWRNLLIRKEEISAPPPGPGEGRSCNSGEQAEILPCLWETSPRATKKAWPLARRYDCFWLFSTPLATNRGWPANNSFDSAAYLRGIQDFCRLSCSWIRQRNLWRLAFPFYCRRWLCPIFGLSHANLHVVFLHSGN